MRPDRRVLGKKLRPQPEFAAELRLCGRNWPMTSHRSAAAEKKPAPRGMRGPRDRDLGADLLAHECYVRKRERNRGHGDERDELRPDHEQTLVE